MPKPQTAFDIWFNENKDSEFLREEYDNYKLSMSQMGERAMSFKAWARGAYQED